MEIFIFKTPSKLTEEMTENAEIKYVDFTHFK